MWMADPHVISALREKRALVAGLIEKLERKLEQHRADLTHIDGVLRLFQPDRDPAEIRPKRLVLTHMSDDMLQHPDRARFETAEDGMIVRLD